MVGFKNICLTNCNLYHRRISKCMMFNILSPIHWETAHALNFRVHRFCSVITVSSLLLVHWKISNSVRLWQGIFMENSCLIAGWSDWWLAVIKFLLQLIKHVMLTGTMPLDKLLSFKLKALKITATAGNILRFFFLFFFMKQNSK